MTIKVKQEDGTEIEAYTKDELESQRNEAVENAKKEALTAYETEKAELANKLKEAEEALNKTGDKEFNFGQLRKSVEELKRKSEESEKAWKEKVTTLESSLNEKELREAIKSYSNGDEEMEKKIRFHFNESLGSISDLNERIAAASVLARVTKDNKIDSGVISSSGAGNGKVKTDGLTETQKALAKRFQFTNVLNRK